MFTLLAATVGGAAIAAELAGGDGAMAGLQAAIGYATNQSNNIACMSIEECHGGLNQIGGGGRGTINVTRDGVAIPSGSKYRIPNKHVQNPNRSGSYGEIKNGKFQERLRLDPPTTAGNKGPNYSHYHKNGNGKHYSPRQGDSDPGF